MSMRSTVWQGDGRAGNSPGIQRAVCVARKYGGARVLSDVRTPFVESYLDIPMAYLTGCYPDALRRGGIFHPERLREEVRKSADGFRRATRCWMRWGLPNLRGRSTSERRVRAGLVLQTTLAGIVAVIVPA